MKTERQNKKRKMKENKKYPYKKTRKEELIKEHGLEKPFKIKDKKKNHGDKKRRENFKSRHNYSEKKDKLKGGYW